MAKLNFKDKWVLVTGASSGLGRAISFYLAKNENANLVIAARRLENLEELKNEIEASSNSTVKIIPVDLSRSQDIEQFFIKTIEMADIYAVINNAGLTYYGRTDMNNLDAFDKIIDVNLKASMKLTLLFLDWFNKKGEGAILNITSEAGLIPTPYQTVYSASKHAFQAFTEALRMENRRSSIAICSFAPGGIATEMLTKSGLDKKHGLNSPFNMNVDKAAKLAVGSFKRKKYLSVPGVMNKLTVFMVRLFPRKWVVAITELIYKLPAN